MTASKLRGPVLPSPLVETCSAPPRSAGTHQGATEDFTHDAVLETFTKEGAKAPSLCAASVTLPEAMCVPALVTVEGADRVVAAEKRGNASVSMTQAALAQEPGHLASTSSSMQPATAFQISCVQQERASPMTNTQVIEVAPIAAPRQAESAVTSAAIYEALPGNANEPQQHDGACSSMRKGASDMESLP